MGRSPATGTSAASAMDIIADAKDLCPKLVHGAHVEV